MKIHTDKLTRHHLVSTLPAGCAIRIEERGSRKRDHAFEVWMGAEPGTDRYGVKRRYAPSKQIDGAPKAATWQDWGDWIAELFALDGAAIIGQYDGEHAFTAQTHEEAYRRAMYRGEDAAYEAAANWLSILADAEAVS